MRDPSPRWGVASRLCRLHISLVSLFRHMHHLLSPVVEAEWRRQRAQMLSLKQPMFYTVRRPRPPTLNKTSHQPLSHQTLSCLWLLINHTVMWTLLLKMLKEDWLTSASGYVQGGGGWRARWRWRIINSWICIAHNKWMAPQSSQLSHRLSQEPLRKLASKTMKM